MTAVDSEDGIHTQLFSQEKGAVPNWNEVINFGDNNWEYFFISTMDGESNSKIIPKQTISMQGLNQMSKRYHCSDDKCISVWSVVEKKERQCLRNSCRNGATCSRMGRVEVCSCVEGFAGLMCQYVYRSLKVHSIQIPSGLFTGEYYLQITSHNTEGKIQSKDLHFQEDIAMETIFCTCTWDKITFEVRKKVSNGHSIGLFSTEVTGIQKSGGGRQEIVTEKLGTFAFSYSLE